jgi:hypothetical protein
VAASPAARPSNGFAAGTPGKKATNGLEEEPRLPLLPVTPRTRVKLEYDSPSSTPSISSSIPFDWEAARGHKPPPYGNTPMQRLRKARQSDAGTAAKAGKTRVVRKKGFIERIQAIPENIMHEISMFPQNIPMPSPVTSAYLIGGVMHFLHLVVRITHGWNSSECEPLVGDLYAESEPWFDWTTFATLAIISVSCANAVRMFMSIKLYHMHRQPDPVSSPRASFVPVDLDFSPLQPPTMWTRMRDGAWDGLLTFWRFLFKVGVSKNGSPSNSGPHRVQQLEVWAPGETEIALFCIYSPVHAFLWMATTGSNWVLMCFVMVGVAVQLQAFKQSFEALLKDRTIIASEVMHEYNDKFVNPRVNPIRKDAAVMTNQSELVNVWEG